MEVAVDTSPGVLRNEVTWRDASADIQPVAATCQRSDRAIYLQNAKPHAIIYWVGRKKLLRLEGLTEI